MHDEMSAALRAAVETLEPYPDGRFAGRGIVICAGGARMFTCAWITIGVLRRTLGCTLPIEVWYIGPDEMGPPMRSLLEEFAVQPVDAMALARRRGAAVLGGWELKPFALLHSRFREILLLDADNVPVADPAFLFDRLEFTETGAVLWPDLVRLARDNPMWSIAGIEFRDTPSVESGQIVVDKARAWKGLALAHWMNQHSDFFYDFLYGDKDTFLFAWLMLGLPFHMVQFPPKRLSLTICQRDFEGVVLFQHRNEIKWVLFGGNRRVEGFQHEDACFALLDELRRKWDGRIFAPPVRSDAARAVEAELIAGRRFRFIRIAIGTLAIELLPDNRISGDADLCGFYWYVEDLGGKLHLVFEAHGRRLSVMERGEDGLWRGSEVGGLQAAVEMAPAAPRPDRPDATRASDDSGIDRILERLLDDYEIAPRDAEVMRDFVGAMRTLALMSATVATRLVAQLDAGGSGEARTALIREALAGLSTRNLLDPVAIRPGVPPRRVGALSRHYTRPQPEVPAFALMHPDPSADLPHPGETVLVLTPVKDASPYLDGYFDALARLDYPSERLSLGFLESDSTDDTMQKLAALMPALARRYARATLWKRDFGFHLPNGVPRWSPAFQIPRRKILARARNHLLFRALADEAWVLWLDIDVIDYPRDLVRRLIATGRDIVHPHCVKQYGGTSFDRNAWRDNGRVHMDGLRGGSDLVRLDSVGGSVLLIRADLHRGGLIFPPFFYGRDHPMARRPGPWGAAGPGEIETEGLGLMAADMGHQCWGMPNLEVLHADQ
jgi:hypothetical protein